MKAKNTRDHFRGCLLGGGIGDALGWPVEFLRQEEINKRVLKGELESIFEQPNRSAEFTDDTQMTLFTAEGILRAECRGKHKGIVHIPSVVYIAYQRWLTTQGYPSSKDNESILSGWLITNKALHQQRAPGNTCLTSLLSGQQGTTDKKINDSKGCGGVKRMAPIGLFFPKEHAFKVAVDCAALTHGHPLGYYSAGAFAYIIAEIIEGYELDRAVESAIEYLEYYTLDDKCHIQFKNAFHLAKSDRVPQDAIKEIGEGWVAEEALAIGIYCALKYRDDFAICVKTAVNHDGDSDSTGSIAGNLLGAYLGASNIPENWISNLELQEVITQVADDLFTRFRDDDEWWVRYPGY